VDIVITDPAGKEVRRFKGPAKLGVNRALWDFGTRKLPQPRERPPNPFRNNESGPEVTPGTYGVTVRFAGREAKGTVKVLSDPHASDLPAATWAERQNALDRARKLHAATTEQIERVIAARKDVDLVLAKLRNAADAANPANPADTGDDGREREADRPLVQAGEKLKKDLTAAEKRLWIPPGTKGLLRDKDLTSKLERLDEALGSSWASPTPDQKAFLEQTEVQVSKVLGEVNQLFDGEVAEFRGQVEKAGVGLFTAGKPAAGR
jgi:hypothetical protein